MNVLVGVDKLELACVKLALDPTKPSLDCGQLRGRQESRRCEAACVGDAACDVEWIKLEIGVKRRRKALELDQDASVEATAPQLAVRGLAGYGVPSPGAPASRARPDLPGERGGPRRLTSPKRLPRSRACSRPWTCADVRTPIPHSLMKPAAAD